MGHSLVEGDLRVVAHRPWPGGAITVSPDGTWAAIALPGRVVVARLPGLDAEREIHVADVRSLVALDANTLALAPHRGVLVIRDPAGTPRVGVRARGVGRVALAAGPDGILAAVGARAALPRATIVTRTDGGTRQGWTAVVTGAVVATWVGKDDLVVAAGEDLVLVRGGEEDARVEAPLGGPIGALASIPGGVVIAGPGPRAMFHALAPGMPHAYIDVLPGTSRSLATAGGLLAVGTRSLGERVVVRDLQADREIAIARGMAAVALAPPLVVVTGREGTLVLAP